MKHILPSLTFLVGIWMASVAPGQFTPIPQNKPVPQNKSEESSNSAVSGQMLVEQAAKRVQAEAAVSADLRYKIDAFGHQLLGTGNYLQLGSGAEKLVRLDLKLQVGERQATLLEIRGPDFYWVRRDVPPIAPTLGRVNLRQLRQSLDTAAEQGTDVVPSDGWIMLGGLPRLLSALQKNFEFEPAKADELQFTAADGQSIQRLPIWIVQGKWKRARLAELAGGDAKAPAAPAEQMPDRVELVLGRTKDVLPLFPYRITYWKKRPKGDMGGAGGGSRNGNCCRSSSSMSIARGTSIRSRSNTIRASRPSRI